jgi:hypothetical protein
MSSEILSCNHCGKSCTDQRGYNEEIERLIKENNELKEKEQHRVVEIEYLKQEIRSLSNIQKSKNLTIKFLEGSHDCLQKQYNNLLTNSTKEIDQLKLDTERLVKEKHIIHDTMMTFYNLHTGEYKKFID